VVTPPGKQNLACPRAQEQALGGSVGVHGARTVAGIATANTVAHKHKSSQEFAAAGFFLGIRSAPKSEQPREDILTV